MGQMATGEQQAQQQQEQQESQDTRGAMGQMVGAEQQSQADEEGRDKEAAAAGDLRVPQRADAFHKAHANGNGVGRPGGSDEKVIIRIGGWE